MLEEWKPVVGYETEYSVSSLGRVRSEDKIVRCNTGFREHKGQFLKGKVNRKTGHFSVALCRAKTVKYRSIHSLVAAAFIGPRPEGLFVCHKNGNAQDNRVENLKYATPKENSEDRRIHGNTKFGENQGFSFLKEQQIREIRRKRAEGATYKKLAKAFGTSMSNIASICKNRTWSYLNG